jgi:hypothetical protein
MVSNTHIQPPQKVAAGIVAIGLRLAATLTLVGLFSSSSAFGQTDYSDFWVDDSNPDAAYIVGIGVTDNDYSADAIGVETTLTSPNGRTVSGQAYDYGSVRVEITLPWDWDDLGDYFVNTRHQPLCWGNWDGSMLYERRSGGTMIWHWNPDYYRCMESRTTSISFLTGMSNAEYVNVVQYGDGTGGFVPIEGCHVTCMVPSFTHQLTCPNSLEYKVRGQPWTLNPITGRRLCLPMVKFVQLANCAQQLAQCYEGNRP